MTEDFHALSPSPLGPLKSLRALMSSCGFLPSVGTWRNKTEGMKNVSRNHSKVVMIHIPLRNNEANRCKAKNMISSDLAGL